MNDTEHAPLDSESTPSDDAGKIVPPSGEHVDSIADSIERPREIGGRKGPDPVRYGDWEKNGRCIDF